MTQGIWPKSHRVRSIIFPFIIPCVLAYSNLYLFMQTSWEAEFDALVAGTMKRDAGPSTATAHDPVDPDAITKLHELLPLSASQVLEREGLDAVGACLNDLAADGRLDNATVTRASSLLDRTREHFGIFARAIRAEDEWKASSTARETLRPQVEVLIAKKERLAELDRQIAELQSRRSAFATELSQEFESNKSCLTEYAANAKRADQLGMDKGVRQAEIIMGEVRWLELKAFLKTVLPTSP